MKKQSSCQHPLRDDCLNRTEVFSSNEESQSIATKRLRNVRSRNLELGNIANQTSDDPSFCPQNFYSSSVTSRMNDIELQTGEVLNINYSQSTPCDSIIELKDKDIDALQFAEGSCHYLETHGDMDPPLAHLPKQQQQPEQNSYAVRLPDDDLLEGVTPQEIELLHHLSLGQDKTAEPSPVELSQQQCVVLCEDVDCGEAPRFDSSSGQNLDLGCLLQPDLQTELQQDLRPSFTQAFHADAHQVDQLQNRLQPSHQPSHLLNHQPSHQTTHQTSFQTDLLLGLKPDYLEPMHPEHADFEDKAAVAVEEKPMNLPYYKYYRGESPDKEEHPTGPTLASFKAGSSGMTYLDKVRLRKKQLREQRRGESGADSKPLTARSRLASASGIEVLDQSGMSGSSSKQFIRFLKSPLGIMNKSAVAPPLTSRQTSPKRTIVPNIPKGRRSEKRPASLKKAQPPDRQQIRKEVKKEMMNQSMQIPEASRKKLFTKLAKPSPKNYSRPASRSSPTLALNTTTGSSRPNMLPTNFKKSPLPTTKLQMNVSLQGRTEQETASMSTAVMTQQRKPSPVLVPKKPALAPGPPSARKLYFPEASLKKASPMKKQVIVSSKGQRKRERSISGKFDIGFLLSQDTENPAELTMKDLVQYLKHVKQLKDQNQQVLKDASAQLKSQQQCIVALLEQQVKFGIQNVECADEIKGFDLDQSLQVMSTLDQHLTQIEMYDLVKYSSSSKATLAMQLINQDLNLLELKYDLIEKDRATFLRDEIDTLRTKIEAMEKKLRVYKRNEKFQFWGYQDILTAEDDVGSRAGGESATREEPLSALKGTNVSFVNQSAVKNFDNSALKSPRQPGYSVSKAAGDLDSSQCLGGNLDTFKGMMMLQRRLGRSCEKGFHNSFQKESLSPTTRNIFHMRKFSGAPTNDQFKYLQLPQSMSSAAFTPGVLRRINGFLRKIQDELLLKEKEIDDWKAKAKESDLSSRAQIIGSNISEIDKQFRLRKLSDRYKELVERFQTKCKQQEEDEGLVLKNELGWKDEGDLTNQKLVVKLLQNNQDLEQTNEILKNQLAEVKDLLLAEDGTKMNELKECFKGLTNIFSTNAQAEQTIQLEKPKGRSNQVSRQCSPSQKSAKVIPTPKYCSKSPAPDLRCDEEVHQKQDFGGIFKESDPSEKSPEKEQVGFGNLVSAGTTPASKATPYTKVGFSYENFVFDPSIKPVVIEEYTTSKENTPLVTKFEDKTIEKPATSKVKGEAPFVHRQFDLTPNQQDLVASEKLDRENGGGSIASNFSSFILQTYLKEPNKSNNLEARAKISKIEDEMKQRFGSDSFVSFSNKLTSHPQKELGRMQDNNEGLTKQEQATSAMPITQAPSFMGMATVPVKQVTLPISKRPEGHESVRSTRSGRTIGAAGPSSSARSKQVSPTTSGMIPSSKQLNTIKFLFGGNN